MMGAQADAVPSLQGLAMVKCARTLVDVSRAPLPLQQYVLRLREWRRAEELKHVAKNELWEKR